MNFYPKLLIWIAYPSFLPIASHTSPGAVRTCIYEGVRNNSISQTPLPDINELLSANIVLTTYDVLKEDLSHDSDRHEGDRRALRFEKRYSSASNFLFCFIIMSALNAKINASLQNSAWCYSKKWCSSLASEVLLVLLLTQTYVLWIYNLVTPYQSRILVLFEWLNSVSPICLDLERHGYDVEFLVSSWMCSSYYCKSDQCFPCLLLVHYLSGACPLCLSFICSVTTSEDYMTDYYMDQVIGSETLNGRHTDLFS